MRPLRLAVIGVGLIGRRHLEIVTRSSACELIAAADSRPSVAEHVTSLGARFYADHRELLGAERPDGVIVATPNATHAQVGIDCARAGVPMLIEKPLSDTLEGAEALVNAAAEAGVAAAVGHHRRFDPAVERAREIIDGGEIGGVLAVQIIWALRKDQPYFDTHWRTERATGGGPGLINLVHDVDLVRYLVGDVDRVYAELGHDGRSLEVEDTLTATLRFDSGALGSLTCSDATPSPWGWEQGSGENPHVPESGHNCYRLLGTRGALALPNLALFRHPEGKAAQWQAPIETMPIAHGPRVALAAQLDDFCAVVRGEKTPRATARDGFATLATTLALIESGASGHPVHPVRLAKAH